MQKRIDVTIERAESITLIFHFDKQIELDISSDNQEIVKIFFRSLLSNIFNDYIDNKIEYSLDFSDDGKDLFHDVAEKYIRNLDNEIQSVYSDLKTNY